MINAVALTGRLTGDIDLRYTQGGTAVGSFRLAVDRNFTNAQGERESDFINCVIWRKSAENFANFTRKGSLVGVQGRIQTRTYDNNSGERVYVTEVVVDNFALLESRETTQNRPQGSQNGRQGGQNRRQGNYSNNRQNGSQGQQRGQNRQQGGYQQNGDNGLPDIKDEDLPF